jgi:ribonuclease-3
MRRVPDQRLAAELEGRIGYTFINPSLLRQALTHRSITNETNESAHNERFEFLGDAVLELIISQMLFDAYPNVDEGELSKLRATAVNRDALALKARAIGLGQALRLGEGEKKSGGAEKDSLLADAFEALVAAIHLDAGFEAAHSFVMRQFSDDIQALPSRARDTKTELQQWCQKHFHKVPTYKIISESGPEHERIFRCEVTLDGKTLGVGEGKSKKVAEQAAAMRALSDLTVGNG